jgi:hypothetical protein
MNQTDCAVMDSTDTPAAPPALAPADAEVAAPPVPHEQIKVAALDPTPDGPTPWDDVTATAPADPPDLEYDISNLQSQILSPHALPSARERSGGGAFTIPLICLGIGLIAMCLLIPAADENRRVAYERDRLKADLEQLQKQVATNEAFLKHVGDDASLAERLARRQLKMVPEGTAVMDLKSTPVQAGMSPFLLVTVPPPAPMPPYKPVGGFLADACRHPKTQLYLIGASLLMIASGLVLSRSSPIFREGQAAA